VNFMGCVFDSSLRSNLRVDFWVVVFMEQVYNQLYWIGLSSEFTGQVFVPKFTG